MITLDNITLPKGIFWHDAFNFVPVKQVNKKSITGRTLLFRSPIQDGREIVLTGTDSSNSLTRSSLTTLSNLRTKDTPFTLDYNGQTHLVKFDLSQQDHFDVSPLWGDTTSHLPESLWYIKTIKLIEVLE